MRDQLQADDVRLEGWRPSATGYSNETNIFTAHCKKEGRSWVKKYVQRVAPAEGRSMFRDYDLERQVQVVEYLGEHSSLPVPQIVGLELSAARPFYVMNCIDGDVPADGHTADQAYTTTGFLYEASPEDRRTYWLDFVTYLAELHKLPVPEAFRTKFQRAPGAKFPLQKEVDWWLDLYNWGKGGPDVASPETDDYVAWIHDNVPDLSDANIVWQDARPANTIVQDFKIVALLDWEIACLGPGELDLFYHFFMHQLRERQEGANTLEGIPSEAEQIEHYESLVGRKVREEEFFRRFARVRGAIIQLIYCRSKGIPLTDISFSGVIDDAAFSGN